VTVGVMFTAGSVTYVIVGWALGYNYNTGNGATVPYQVSCLVLLEGLKTGRLLTCMGQGTLGREPRPVLLNSLSETACPWQTAPTFIMALCHSHEACVHCLTKTWTSKMSC
jgi:hypothetical protein